MKRNLGLSHPYLSIEGSYGGSQSWFSEKIMRGGGCGVVAAGDLLLYLSQHRYGCLTEETHGIVMCDGSISKSRYEQYIKMLRRRYFPLIPKLGMPYWVLILGLNRYFWKHRIPLKARWGVLPWNLDKRIEEMLSADVPVIFAVGPNFPLFFRKKKLNFYVQQENGLARVGAKTSAHYVTVTAADNKNYRISSWGKSYFVDKEEYRRYVLANSNYLMCNICYINERKKN